MFTLACLEPGHFHAALTLRERRPLLRDEMLVYARPGPELDAFLGLVRDFNGRSERPTAWQPEVVFSDEPLQRLLDDRRADVVVLAGRNDSKLVHLRRLHEAGLHVLGDKPWVTGPEQLVDLEATTDGRGALALDVMTSRHEWFAVLLRRLVDLPDVFGRFRVDEAGALTAPVTAEEAAIQFESVHCLAKTVNGRPLLRPPWYFDIRVQGDGIVDVPSHLVDLAQWLLGGEPFDYASDVRALTARRWATEVPAARFERITGARAFPQALAPWVRDGALGLLANGEIACRLRGVPVLLRSEWWLGHPGGGDTQQVLLRGTRADLAVEQGAATAFQPRLTVRPRSDSPGVAAALRAAVAAWQGDLPGLSVGRAGTEDLELTVPPALHTTHEEHFALVLDAFLHLAATCGAHGSIAADLRCKYSLLAHASRIAQQEA